MPLHTYERPTGRQSAVSFLGIKSEISSIIQETGNNIYIEILGYWIFREIKNGNVAYHE